MARNLFAPLLEQLVHWYTNRKAQPLHAGALLDAISDGKSRRPAVPLHRFVLHLLLSVFFAVVCSEGGDSCGTEACVLKRVCVRMADGCGLRIWRC